MSLFASLGQGDVWALSGISFASPINDLLDKGEFTLENLLEEDELIQEVKAKNAPLIDFLSRGDVVNNLLDYIICPADPSDNELKMYKYPYMSCEVICCEVPEILLALVENNDGACLDKLFTFLSSPQKLDYYLAGYFEKILEMLFRRMTVPMMSYFNTAGSPLLNKFLDHVDTYSIMQIVQRLMLPHIPFVNLDDEADLTDEERIQRQCNWAYSIESCELLFERMLELKDTDVPLHISDLLITVLQLSPPETLVISFLCEPTSIDRLMKAIVGPSARDGTEDYPGEASLDIANPGDSYSCAGAVSLAAVSVLESLSSRLFEASLPFDQSMSQVMEGSQEHLVVVRQQIDVVCTHFLPHVPRLQEILQGYLKRNPCKAFVNQSKSEVQRLGHRGLHLVKLIEAVVRMGSVEVDDSFCQCGLFRTCLELMFHFDNNSFLHLSVQRIIITVLESDRSRSMTQRHLLTECDLLPSMMTRIEQYSTAPSAEGSSHDEVLEVTEKAESSNDVSTGKRSTSCSMTPKHSSVMGNLLLIAQALSVALDAEGGLAPQMDGAQGQDPTNLDATGNSFLTDSSVDAADDSCKTNPDQDTAAAGVGAIAGSGEEQPDLAKPGCLRELLLPGTADNGVAKSEQDLIAEAMLKEWDAFVIRTLHSILDHQMVGTYSANIANLSAMSQDDPMKLGVDLDMFHLNGQGGGGSEKRNNVFEGDDMDDEFMFAGPPADAEFKPNFDFARRQDFTSSGFNLEGGTQVEAFADFAAFGDQSDPSSEFEQQPGSFADFASFADFDASAADSFEEPADQSTPIADDFAPTTF